MQSTTPPRHPDRDRNADGRPENARPRDQFGAPLPRGSVDELAHRVEPEDVCTTVEQAVNSACRLFDQQRFFEAHEFFEWAWKGPVTNDEDRPFFKAMAQLAVGYCHTQRGNHDGARSLLQRAVRGLQPFLPTRHRIDVAAGTEDAERFLAALEEAPGRPLEFSVIARGDAADPT